MIPIYCISLKRKRNERFCRLNENFFKKLNLNVKEWEAVDGIKFNNSSELVEKYNLKLTELGNELNKSIIATAISHRSVWKDIIKNDLEAAIIFEDDVKIKKNFNDKILKLWNLIKDDNNINHLLLSYVDDNLLINVDKSIYNKDIYKLKLFNGFFCYLLKKKGAELFIEHTDKLSYQIDIQISKKINSIYGCVDKLAYCDDEVQSTIHLSRFKILEILFNIKFLNKKLFNLFDSFSLTYFSLVIIIISFICVIINLNLLYTNLLNFVILFADLKIFGSRIDELNFRIKGIINFSSYDTDEVINKFFDHILFSLLFTSTKLIFR